MHQEIKGHLDLWDPQAHKAPWGNLDLKVQLVMMALQDGMVLLVNVVIVETLGLPVCQALRAPLELPVLLVLQETQDREEIRVHGVL